MFKKFILCCFLVIVSVSAVFAGNFWDTVSHTSFSSIFVGDDKFSPSALSYSFAASSGTFTQIVSPDLTILQNTNDEFSVQSLPFSFEFEGTTHSTVTISTNGWLAFGNFTDSDSNNDLTFSSTRPLVAPFWDELRTTASGGILIKTTGTAPNRVYTVEWRNTDIFNSDRPNTPSLSFQAKLFETSNAIDFVYKQEANPFIQAGGSIGLAGSNTGSGNFVSLDGSGTNPTASTSIETAQISTRPATGQIYSFTPLIVTEVGFQLTASNAIESDGNVTLTVRRTGDTVPAFTVDFATADQTAIAGSDYSTTTGTLSFASGETSKTISVPLINDGDIEGDETFTVNLSNVTNGFPLGSSVHTVTLQDSGPIVNFSVNSSTVVEGAAITVTFTRSGILTNSSQIEFQTQSGSAVVGEDFTDATQTVSFAQNETTKTVVVQTLEDSLGELTQNFVLRIVAPTNCLLGSPSQLTLDIIDNEAMLTVSPADYDIQEDAGNVVLNVVRSGDTSQVSTAQFATFNQTASGRFTPTSGTVTFNSGESLKTISVAIIDDLIVNADGEFFVRINNPSANTSIGVNNQGQVFIRNNDDTPVNISAASLNQTVVEHVGNVNFVVTRGGNLTKTVTVLFNTLNSTAIAPGDFTNVTQTLTFLPNETSKNISIPIIDDNVLEVNEQLVVALSNFTNGSFPTSTTQTNVTITDNEPRFSVEFANYAVNESAGTISIKILKNAASSVNAASVDFETRNGSATSPNDYTTISGTLNFPSGSLDATLNIPIINDTVIDPNEVFGLSLKNPTSGGFGTITNSVISITDNEPAFSFNFPSYTVRESVGAVNVVVSRTSATTVETVQFSTVDGTATAPSDYTSTSGTLNYLVGETSKTITIPINNDGLVEQFEKFSLELIVSSFSPLLVDSSLATTVNISEPVFLPGSRTAILGTSGFGGQAIIFPDARVSTSLPQFAATGFPAGASPHGVAYFGTDNSLVSDFDNSRIFVVKNSTSATESIVNTSGVGYGGRGTIAVSPSLTTALACDSNALFKISAPFNASSPISTLILPSGTSIPSFQTQAIVFNSTGRAFVYHTGGISVIDPPYNSIAFTIPIANSTGGAIAITPNGNTLLITFLSGNVVGIINAPFSAASTPTPLAIPGGNALDGIMVTADGSKAIVVSAFARHAAVISAPFSGNLLASIVETIPLPPSTSTQGFEDVGISADGQVAIITGNGTTNNSLPVLIQAPFGSNSETVEIPINSSTPGRGAGAVRFLPAALAPTAANVAISGRVITASGRGIRNVVVQISGGNLSETRYARTNPFGYYRFTELDAGQTYALSVSAKRYSFANPTRVITLNEDLTGEDFVSENTK